MKFSKIPTATITRLSRYSRALEELDEQGLSVISSEKLAQYCEVNSAQIRKDLAYFGEFGVRGVGYVIKELLFEIKRILGLNKTWHMGIIGMGNMGCALIDHSNFPGRAITSWPLLIMILRKSAGCYLRDFPSLPCRIWKKLP